MLEREREIAKEGVEPTGLSHRENPAFAPPDILKPMGYVARRKDRSSPLRRYLTPADFKDKLAFEHVEPFVLAMMHVQRRTASRRDACFPYGVLAVGVLGRNLDSNGL